SFSHALEVEFQSELQLSRVVRVIARTGNPAEILRVDEVPQRRRGEIRRVGQVERLGTELQHLRLQESELFEQGKIQTVEARPDRLCGTSAERRIVALSDRSGHWRIREGGRIQPLIYIVRPGGQTLAWHQQCI